MACARACAQTLGVTEIPLSTAEFMKEPRKVVQLDVPLFKPEAHGHLLKLAKVGGRLLHASRSCCHLRCCVTGCSLEAGACWRSRRLMICACLGPRSHKGLGKAHGGLPAALLGSCLLDSHIAIA